MSTMMFSLFDIGKFAAGLAIFLFAMMQMEAALKLLGSRSIKVFLQRHTQNPIKAIFGGALATAVLQSSSVVGLITLAFVGAGILELTHALGIIIGSNLGTTLTGWIVATLGFKFILSDFNLYLFGLGCFGVVIFNPERKPYQFSKLTIGIGLLLMGLVLMKESMEKNTQLFDVSGLKQYGLLVFFFSGLLFTAIIQSSSATMVITLSALHAEIIPLGSAAALIIGAGLGTTGTVLLGGIKGSVSKKQVALAHFIFNLVTSLLALAALPWLLYLVTDIYAIDDPLFSLVALHSSINFFGLLLFVPFLSQFKRFLQFLFPANDTDEREYINNVSPKITDAALAALEQEAGNVMAQVIQLNSICLNINLKQSAHILENKKKLAPDASYINHYDSLKRLEGKIIDYVIQCQPHCLKKDDSIRLTQQLDSVRDLVFSTKPIKDIRADLKEFLHSSNPKIMKQFEFIQEQMRKIYLDLDELFVPMGKEELYEKFTQLVEQVEQFHQSYHLSIFEESGTDGLSEINISTFFNVNRELLLSNIYLLKALENKFFEPQEIKTLSALSPEL